MPCLFLSPQPLPLFPSCTRSVPPWGASPCHGHSRSSPMASSWTMRSDTMRRWASSAWGLQDPGPGMFPRWWPAVGTRSQAEASPEGRRNLVMETTDSLGEWWGPGDTDQRSSLAKAFKTQALTVLTQKRTVLSGQLTGQNQFHSPSHMLAILMQVLQSYQGSPELSVEFVVL